MLVGGSDVLQNSELRKHMHCSSLKLCVHTRVCTLRMLYVQTGCASKILHVDLRSCGTKYVEQSCVSKIFSATTTSKMEGPLSS